MGRSDPHPALPTPTPPPAALAAWLAQSRDLLALTDAIGRIGWANAAFERCVGLGVGADLLNLAPPPDPQSDPSADARGVLQAALVSGLLVDATLRLRGPTGAPLWLRISVASVGNDRLWTLLDTTAQRELAAQSQRRAELLDLAQEFGRLGVWERDIPSGKGQWDRHVFDFLGVEPGSTAPDRRVALRHTHPDDAVALTYERSARQAGRYSQRYRVVHPDGTVRRLHSQWEVKNSPEGRPDRAIGIVMDDTKAYEIARSLDHSAAHLQLAVDLADLIVWRYDLKTARAHFTERGYEMLGRPFTPEGLTPAEVAAYEHPDDAAATAASIRQALKSSQPVDVETRYRRADGRWRYLLTRRAAERDANGRVTAFVGVSLDVTERVEEPRRAAYLAQRLEIATRVAGVGIWTATVGTTETEWDERMFELFDMIGAARPPTIDEFLANCIHPDDAPRVASAIRAHRPRRDGRFAIEFRVRLRDGGVRWLAARADIDRSTSVPRAFGIAIDVTERHLAQTALHAANERAALIARHAGIGTWETQEDTGGPARWDEQMFRLRGLEPGPTSLSREQRLALVHPDDLDQVLDTRPERDHGPLPAAYEFRVRWPDGKYRWLASRSAALFDANGKVMRRVGVNWDITDHKNAEAARQQALLAERESQAKSQFLSRMSHELRTPLNAVLGFAQLLQLDARAQPGHASTDGEQLAKLDHIRAAGEHLLTLINDALDLTGLETGTLKLELQPVSIALAVARALPFVKESAAARRITIHTAALDGVVQADPTRLQQVLLNLLSNAVKYNRDGGSIVIEAAIAGPQARLRVRDTGRGMSTDQLAHLFEPFNRLGIEGEGIEGSGIGMTIARALVEGMGGRIGVTSELGFGTSFEVRLPRARADGDMPAAHADAPEPTTRSDHAPITHTDTGGDDHAGQLLYIEDNAVNVLLVEELVTRLSGLRLVSEASGAAGVSRARSLRPDLILVDMQLPDFDGFEVLRQLRGHAETAAIPCIALSANAMPVDIARGLAGGFDDYWTKPIRFREFLDALQRRFPATARR